MKIFFNPIGIVHNKINLRHDMTYRGIASEIHILPKYRKALLHIEKEKYLWVLCYLHQGRRDVLVATPRKAKKIVKTPRGVFAMRSPDRPNPIALTKVRLLARKGLILEVSGLDVIDGTPVLDLKNYKR